MNGKDDPGVGAGCVGTEVTETDNHVRTRGVKDTLQQDHPLVSELSPSCKERTG